MADNVRRVDPRSPTYQKFADLYRAAHDLRPGGTNRWNGQLYAHDGRPWGSFDLRAGSMRVSQQLVLDHLTGSTTPPPSQAQAQALVTVFREANRARVELDAPGDPTAVRTGDTIALNAGLSELRSSNDFPLLAARNGYGGLELDGHQYEGAVEATERLLAYAAGTNGADALLTEATNRPVSMQWHPIADELVRNHLRDVVPQHPGHQQAARTAVVEAMNRPNWEGIQYRSRADGQILADDTQASVNTTLQQIRQHYRSRPETPYRPDPAGAPEAGVELSPRRSPAAGTDRPATAPAQSADPRDDPAVRAAFGGAHLSAAGATARKPDLGDGSRRPAPVNSPNQSRTPITRTDP